MADLVFSVEGQAESKTRIQANARQFSIVIDEPPTLGGDDLGANPVEYLLASYAGCVNVMAYLIANELNIKLEHLKLKLMEILILTDYLANRTMNELDLNKSIYR